MPYDCGEARVTFTLPSNQAEMQRARQALTEAGLLLSDDERAKLARKLATDTPLSRLVTNERSTQAAIDLLRSWNTEEQETQRIQWDALRATLRDDEHTT